MASKVSVKMHNRHQPLCVCGVRFWSDTIGLHANIFGAHIFVYTFVQGVCGVCIMSMKWDGFVVVLVCGPSLDGCGGTCTVYREGNYWIGMRPLYDFKFASSYMCISESHYLSYNSSSN